MAVFTQLSLHEAQEIGEAYAFDIMHIQAISEGITNSNFVVQLRNGSVCILTIIEQHTLAETTPIIDLIKHLPNEIPHAKIYKTNQQKSFHTYKNKPVIMSQYLIGKSIDKPTNEQIAQIATTMAYLHQTKPEFKIQNKRNINWMQAIANNVMDKLSSDDQTLLQQSLDEIQQADFNHLSKSIIHHDLFRDNALFYNTNLNGIIDFYYACFDFTLIDIAIVINDWCFDKPQLFLDPYQKHYALQKDTLDLLPLFRRYACLNFWLSRLSDFHFPKCKGHTTIKSPNEMKNKLIILKQ